MVMYSFKDRYSKLFSTLENKYRKAYSLLISIHFFYHMKKDKKHNSLFLYEAQDNLEYGKYFNETKSQCSSSSNSSEKLFK